MPAPKLFGYPKETVAAEKLHSIIYRGSATSRRKDFYDLWFISQQFDFEGALLQQAIINTFENRATPLPKELPVSGVKRDCVNHKRPAPLDSIENRSSKL